MNSWVILSGLFLNQMPLCHKIERMIFLQQIFGGTPPQESEDMMRKLEGTRNVQGCYVAKTQTQQMCRSQGIDGQLVIGTVAWQLAWTLEYETHENIYKFIKNPLLQP